MVTSQHAPPPSSELLIYQEETIQSNVNLSITVQNSPTTSILVPATEECSQLSTYTSQPIESCRVKLRAIEKPTVGVVCGSNPGRFCRPAPGLTLEWHSAFRRSLQFNR